MVGGRGGPGSAAATGRGADRGTLVRDVRGRGGPGPGGHNDTDGTSTCYNDCAALWPAVPAGTAISSSLDSSLFGSTTRDDGTEQLTVGGQPLYRYSPDANPGDTTGQNFNGVWFVVGVDGQMIGASASSSTPAGYNRSDY